MTRPSKSMASWAACCLSLAALVAGCGGKGEETSTSSGGGGGGGGSVETDFGVTDSEIKLGVLTDLSGVFAPLGDPIVKANQIYWDQVNADGGVCDRDVTLVVKDHGYDPQKAVVQYDDLSQDVVALQQLLGSPISAALLPTLEEDSMASILVAWPSSLLPKDFIIEVGGPYDIEMINGLSYLMDEGKIKEGDKLGHIYFEGEYGENGLAGSTAFAEENGMEIVEQKIEPTDEDMTGAVSALKNEGVKAILLTTSPTQMGSAAGIAATQDFNVPLLGNNPTYDVALLDTPAADALKANAIIAGPLAAYDAKDPGPSDAVAAYEKKFPDDPKKNAIFFGFGAGEVMRAALEQACEDGDLTRAGVLEAARSVESVDTKGLTPGALSYNEVGQPATRSTFIAKVSDAEGGLTLEDTVESDFAKSYEIPGAE